MKDQYIYMLIILLYYLIITINALDIRPYYDTTKGDIVVHNFLKENKINKITMAFILGQDCIPNFNYISTNDSIKNLNNMDVWISFGGANAPYIEYNCQNKTLLFNNINNIVNNYNATGIDFDIEDNMLPTYEIHKLRAEVLKMLKNKYKNKITIGYTLPADEYGLNKQIGYLMLNNTKNIFIPDYINPMAMFLRDRSNKTLNKNIEKTIISVNKDINEIYNINRKEIFEKMGVTVNIAGDDHNPFKTEHVEKLIKFCKNKNMFFVSFWELGKNKGIDIYKSMTTNLNSF